MRVIGGEFRSRILKTLPGLDTRPTPDRMREALFNILTPRIEGTVFLDAYAGTGAVGIEALSRGARKAIFIEQSRAAVGIIRRNLKSLEIETRADVRQGPVLSVLSSFDADIVFLDPPYESEREYEAAMEKLGNHPPALAIVQHDVRLKLAQTYGTLHQSRVLRQGDNCLTFFEG